MKNSSQNSISFRHLITETYKDVLVQVNGRMGSALPRGLYISEFIFSYFTECRGNVIMPAIPVRSLYKLDCVQRADCMNALWNEN
jgi:hypothetical protein